MKLFRSAIAATVALTLAASSALAYSGPKDILNVSYDISRELFAEINVAFQKYWKAKTGQDVTINQSHAGSSKQARAILEGLAADVVTFNQTTDVQVLHDKGNLVAADWREKFPNAASPYYSLPVFLVRKGNPQKIHDWNDLARDGVGVIFPNPKTSGNARYTYLAATAYAYEKFGAGSAEARDFVKKFLGNVLVFDTGGRGATTTFVEREIGDALITFEAEAQVIARQFPDREFEVVVPSLSLLAEFPVAVVDSVADRRGSWELATEYLNFLYSKEGQDILAKNFNRVHDTEIVEKYAKQFPEVRLVTVEDVFGGWETVSKTHFEENGILDQLLVNR
jgi:sulfate transport system substrate-binding protein